MKNEDTWLSEWDSFITEDKDLLYVREKGGTIWYRHVAFPGRQRRVPQFYKECLEYDNIQFPVQHLIRVTTVIG
jgi:hypothetical protein